MRTLVIGNDDDVFGWCGCEVQELLEKSLCVGGVGAVGRHVNQLPIVAPDDPVDSDTPPSGRLHG